MACVNVGTLHLARSVARRREFAIRAALGASPMRHLRQLLAESVVLAALGCAGGLLLAAWFAPLTAAFVPTPLRDQLGLATPSLDWHVLAFAIAASSLSAVAAGIAPAVTGWDASPLSSLSDGGRTGTAGAHRTSCSQASSPSKRC
jgi:putative ABC transport system permease protein